MNNLVDPTATNMDLNRIENKTAAPVQTSELTGNTFVDNFEAGQREHLRAPVSKETTTKDLSETGKIIQNQRALTQDSGSTAVQVAPIIDEETFSGLLQRKIGPNGDVSAGFKYDKLPIAA